MITYREVKIAVAVWAAVMYGYWSFFGTPADPTSFHGQGLKLQGLMRVIN